jgi:hypothetical protein
MNCGVPSYASTMTVTGPVADRSSWMLKLVGRGIGSDRGVGGTLKYFVWSDFSSWTVTLNCVGISRMSLATSISKNESER